MSRPRLRRAGSPWRILVHEWVGSSDEGGLRWGEGGLRYGRAYDVSNNPGRPAEWAETIRHLNEMNPGGEPFPDVTECTVLEGTEFDELVIGKWMHLEQVDTGRWWMNVGGVTINVTADRDGRPRRVSVSGPGDYAEPEKGCTYALEWSAGD